jgi:hypothetical protein
MIIPRIGYKKEKQKVDGDILRERDNFSDWGT